MYKLIISIAFFICFYGYSSMAAMQPAFLPAVSLLLSGGAGCSLPSDAKCATFSNLKWMRIDDGVLRTFDDAGEYCEDLDHLGYTDWRMPEQRELECLVDKDETMSPPYIKAPLFVKSDAAYWAKSGERCRIGVDFVDGSTNAYNNKTLYIRCVR